MKEKDSRRKKKYVIPRPYTELGEYLQAMRIRAGLSQRDVSLALNYSSAQFISNFERGIAIPPLKKLRLLVTLLNLVEEHLVDLILESKAEIMRKELMPRGKTRLG